MRPNNGETLLLTTFRITVYGMMLSSIMGAVYHRLGAQEVATICCFLAAAFVFKVVMPPRPLIVRYWGSVAAMAVSACFSWWLIYQAENTRAGWYRFHVLQSRVQQLVAKAPTYVITADCDGYVTGASENIGQLVGWGRDDIIGKHIHMFMREEAAALHDAAYAHAAAVLRADGGSPNAGWALQGAVTVGVRHRDGRIVPVRIYAGGIRWSQDVPFPGDIDFFAVFVPVPRDEAALRPTTITADDPVRRAPPAPGSPTIIPLPQSPHRHVQSRADAPLIAVPGSRGQDIRPATEPR